MTSTNPRVCPFASESVRGDFLLYVGIFSDVRMSHPRCGWELHFPLNVRAVPVTEVDKYIEFHLGADRDH